MATDIAFALGVLALLGDRVPLSLKIFLTAFAIVDDIGAVLVIAIFYTDQIAQGPLLLAGGIFAACVMANWLGVRRPLVYTILGVVLWVAFLKSGIHATIAGVLLALTIPTSARIDTPDFLYYGKRLLNIIEKSAPEATEKDARTDIILKQERESALYALEIACEKVQSPLQRLEHFLHPWVSFFIMPIFALANAGVELHSANALLQPVSYGIIVGLLVGKPVGVLLCSYLAVRLKISDKPHDLSWRQIFGAGLLGGIGFTMSLFITSLAFREGALIPTAKLAILFASVIAGTTGFFLLRGGSVGNASRIEPPQDSKPQIQNSSP
jgi:Na+:H+ antiporter, NhaA family